MIINVQVDDKKTTCLQPEQESRTVSTSSSNLSLPSNNNTNNSSGMSAAASPTNSLFHNTTQDGSTTNVYQVQDEGQQQGHAPQNPAPQHLGIPHCYPGNPYLQKTPALCHQHHQQHQQQHRCDSLSCCQILQVSSQQSGLSQGAIVSQSHPSIVPSTRYTLPTSHVIGPGQSYNCHLEADFQTKYIQHLNRFILQSDLNVGGNSKQYSANHSEALEYLANQREVPLHPNNSDVTPPHNFNYF